MIINEKEVLHIAKLARLSLSKEEVKRFQRELSSVLTYIEKLKEVDISNVDPVFSSVPPLIIEEGKKLREDKPRKKQENISGRLLSLAPKTNQGYLQVKPVFEKDES